MEQKNFTGYLRRGTRDNFRKKMHAALIHTDPELAEAPTVNLRSTAKAIVDVLRAEDRPLACIEIQQIHTQRTGEVLPPLHKSVATLAKNNVLKPVGGVVLHEGHWVQKYVLNPRPDLIPEEEWRVRVAAAIKKLGFTPVGGTVKAGGKVYIKAHRRGRLDTFFGVVGENVICYKDGGEFYSL